MCPEALPFVLRWQSGALTLWGQNSVIIRQIPNDIILLFLEINSEYITLGNSEIFSIIPAKRFKIWVTSIAWETTIIQCHYTWTLFTEVCYYKNQLDMQNGFLPNSLKWYKNISKMPITTDYSHFSSVSDIKPFTVLASTT